MCSCPFFFFYCCCSSTVVSIFTPPPLTFSVCPLYMFLDGPSPVIPYYPLPIPLWLLSVCSLFHYLLHFCWGYCKWYCIFNWFFSCMLLLYGNTIVCWPISYNFAKLIYLFFDSFYIFVWFFIFCFRFLGVFYILCCLWIGICISFCLILMPLKRIFLHCTC